MQRLLPPLLVLLLLAAMSTVTVLESTPWLNRPMRAAGVVPLLAGAALLGAGNRLFSRANTNIKTFDDPDVLVVDGVFGVSRNPMYLGFLLVLAGASLLFGSMGSWIGPIVFFFAAHRWYIPFEEQRATAVFGADYHQYRRSVRRWIGRSRRYRNAEVPT